MKYERRLNIDGVWYIREDCASAELAALNQKIDMCERESAKAKITVVKPVYFQTQEYIEMRFTSEKSTKKMPALKFLRPGDIVTITRNTDTPHNRRY